VDVVGRSILQELLDKTPSVLQALPEAGSGWTAHRALFAQAGFTEAAQADALTHHVLLVNLVGLDEDLGR
jgi:hypothetical protein